jgi:guanylate kinase
MKRSAILLVISAPSGGGKTTVCQQLLGANAAMRRAVTCTTRTPRTGEKDGVDYYFLTPETFEQNVQAGLFLEHATVYQHRYGTLKSEVQNHLRAGRDVLLAMDVQGVATLKQRAKADAELSGALVTAFITPLSIDVLAERLRKRGTDSEEVRQRRLGAAKDEIARWPIFDYLIVSSTIAEDMRRMQSILEVEKLKSSRVTHFEA